jgi:hypothetical protein
MLVSLVLAVALVAAPTFGQSNFTFTAPAAGTVLNLSAPSIEIQWTSEDTDPASEVDLSWHGQFEDGSTSYYYGVVENISVADGQYLWNPEDTRMALESNKNNISDGNDYYFEAKLHNSGAEVMSEKYSVTGYEFIGAAGALQPQMWAALLMVASLSIVFEAL